NVSEQEVGQNTLTLKVDVDRQQDVAFKSNLSTQLANLGLGPVEIVAREGESIYLRLPSAPQPAKTRPRNGSTPDPGPNGVPPSRIYQDGYRKSWAVIIGINAYQKWPKLEYAVNDAKAIGDVLRTLGFDEVVMLLDGEATQKNILRVLGDDLKAKTQDEDRVFIFFAGHGQTEDLANGKMGYIIPVEGERDNYYSTAISMHQLQDLT